MDKVIFAPAINPTRNGLFGNSHKHIQHDNPKIAKHNCKDYNSNKCTTLKMFNTSLHTLVFVRTIRVPASSMFWTATKFDTHLFNSYGPRSTPLHS